GKGAFRLRHDYSDVTARHLRPAGTFQFLEAPGLDSMLRGLRRLHEIFDWRSSLARLAHSSSNPGARFSEATAFAVHGRVTAGDEPRFTRGVLRASPGPNADADTWPGLDRPARVPANGLQHHPRLLLGLLHASRRRHRLRLPRQP